MMHILKDNKEPLKHLTYQNLKNGLYQLYT